MSTPDDDLASYQALEAEMAQPDPDLPMDPRARLTRRHPSISPPRPMTPSVMASSSSSSTIFRLPTKTRSGIFQQEREPSSSISKGKRSGTTSKSPNSSCAPNSIPAT